jgi:phosphohistidine swiveling domain-containing protein
LTTENPLSTIVQFNSKYISTLEQAGGKALALMQMTKAGMPVPSGFVLTVDFFKPWLDFIQRSSHLSTLATASVHELGAAARALQDLCHVLNFSSEQTAEINDALAEFRQVVPGQLFAVRSSSPEEDLEGASFAGGYETTLGVTENQLEAAIRHSFTSSFDERIFLYKKEHGFRLDQPRIAVIVQQQINAESAGVAFSLNPLNNCYDEAVINANFGLGESVVAGEAEPDLFVVDKPTCRILEARVGSKQTVIQLDQTGGTIKSTRRNHLEAAITIEQALALTDLLQQVEAHYQKPVDIEWAIADGKNYLLQARPITSYLPLPPEMVTAPGAPKHLYANSTLIEQGLQQPLSVLGTDFLNYVLDQVGGAVAKGVVGEGGTVFTATGGYYMDISYARKLNLPNGGLAPGSMGDPRVTAILDSIDMRPYLQVELSDKLKAMRGKMVFAVLPMLKGVLEAYFNPAHILKQYQSGLPEENRRVESFSGAGLTLREQAIQLSELLQFFYGDFGIPMILASQLAQQRIKGLFKGDAVQDQITNLGIALPGNKTTEMGEEMYALASSPELKRFDSPSAFLSALNQGSVDSVFARHWKQFLAEFGMRCPAEIDPATPRPNEQPELFFEQLKNMSLAINGERSFFDDARKKREAAYQALYEIALKKGKRKAQAFDRYYHRWLTFGGYRETPKHYVIKVVALFRRQALEIAKTLVESGRLDKSEQIFDLTIEDIDNALTNPEMDLRALAQERSALINKIKSSHLVARIIDSRGKIYYPPRVASVEGELNGVPISPGMVQGRVKVLNYANEKPMLHGEILVARATDPGWTPLFINAKGIILEIGGVLQHGAVVAREYGIPCVSGVDDATLLLKDGQLVEVDGSNGIVRILDGDVPTSQPISEAEKQKQQEIQARHETGSALLKQRQTLMRLIPMALPPLVILCLVTVVIALIRYLK